MKTIKFITWDEGTDGIAVEVDGREVWSDTAHDGWDQFFRHYMTRGVPFLLDQDTRPSEREQARAADDRDYPQGESTMARLKRWLVDNEVDPRIRDTEYDDEDRPLTTAENVTISGDNLYDLLWRVAERMYWHGVDDIREPAGLPLSEFSGQFTVIPDRGTTALHCHKCAAANLRAYFEIGYHPSLDVVINRAREHNQAKHGG